MGNLSYLVSAPGVTGLTTANVQRALRAQFPLLVIDRHEGFDMLNITVAANEDTVCSIWVEECYLIQEEDLAATEADAKTEGDEVNLERVAKIRALGLDPFASLAINYPPMHLNQDNREAVVSFLRHQFNAYLFDEGIHPEYETPEYVSRREQKALDTKKPLLKRLFG